MELDGWSSEVGVPVRVFSHRQRGECRPSANKTAFIIEIKITDESQNLHFIECYDRNRTIQIRNGNRLAGSGAAPRLTFSVGSFAWRVSRNTF